LTELEIIEGCKNENPKAQRFLVDHYSPRLMALCIRYLRDKEIAKDVLQESYILIFQNIKRFELTGSFEGWLNRITVNTSLKHLRSKVITQDLNDTIQAISLYNEGYEKLEADDILKILDKLSSHYRLIFNLYVVEGYSHAEIAKMLDITESTSRSKLSRARNKVKSMFLNLNEKIKL